MLKCCHCQEKPTALTTVIYQEQVVEPDTNEEVKYVMRLNNSEILSNLDEKLKHLSPPQRTDFYTSLRPDAPGAPLVC